MMRRHLYGIIGLIILGLVSTAVVSAQVVTPPPVNPPPAGVGLAPVGQPSLSILQRVRPPGQTGGARFGPGGYPFDFRFADQIVGYFFKPGEQVTVTADNVSASPVTATADQNGAFDVALFFTWRFCGPSATRAAAPVFHARGNQGSQADLSEFAPPCPELVPLIPQQIPAPLQKPIAGTVQPVGTAVAVGPGVVPPPSVPPSAAPVPDPVYGLQPVTVELQGFGFVSGEHVIITVDAVGSDSPSGAQGSAAPAPVAVTADDLGRLQVFLQVNVPPPCSGLSSPLVRATGDKGTSFTAPLFWFRPMVYMCPVHGAPAPVPAPGDAAAPVSPAPSTAGLLSLRLQRPMVNRGKMEGVTIQSGSDGAISLSVSYAGHSGIRRTLQASAARPLTVRWRVARTALKGRALVRITAAPTKASLQASFTVK